MPGNQDLLFGRIAVQLGFCTAAQVEACLLIQSRSKRPMSLGHHLVSEGALTEEQHSQVLENQRRNLAKVETSTKLSKGDVLFGRLAVREGLATEEQINAALREQGRPGDRRTLGEVLLARGVLKAAEIEWLLQQQSKWVMRCPKCEVTLTVHSSSKNPRKASCPRCKVALVPVTQIIEAASEGEIDTSVMRSQPPRAPDGKGCKLCDHPFVSDLGPDGRVECLSCRTRFVP